MNAPLAYYNENDPVAAHVLRALIASGVIAPGVVDERSIKEVQPDDLDGFAQCHFFAGSGAWSTGARIAGWPDDSPLWTASAPCQPFSCVGGRGGIEDERHLWPEIERLTLARNPPVLVGEQSGSAAGQAWFDAVAAGLERYGYACRAKNLTPLVVGARQIRQRLWFVACADSFTPPRPAKSRGQSFHWPPEPAMGCLAYGVAGRADFLRLAGNAIDPRLAAQVLGALIDISLAQDAGAA